MRSVAASNGGRRGGFGPARIAKYLVAAAGCALIGLQVARTSVVAASVRRNLPLALAADPENPRARMALAMAEFRGRNGAVSPASRAAATAALAKAPLAEEPFFLEGLNALATGDPKRGEQLLNEAVRRNPRSRAARLLLLDRHLRRNDVAKAGFEIAVLNRLIPRAGEVLVPELARMVSDPQTGSAVVRVLEQEPKLQQMVLARLASTGADPELILRIAGSSNAAAATAQGLPWQRALITKLVEKRDLAQAYALWRKFSGLPAQNGAKGLYNGRFQALPGSAPFNWEYLGGAAGAAVATKAPALEVEYYGRENFEFARQLLILAPGSYRIRFRAEGDAKGDDAKLAWTLTCLGSTSPLLTLPLQGIDASPRAVSASFRVAPGCKGQWLRLAGVAGEFGTTQSLLISDMVIEAEKGS